MQSTNCGAAPRFTEFISCVSLLLRDFCSGGNLRARVFSKKYSWDPQNSRSRCGESIVSRQVSTVANRLGESTRNSGHEGAEIFRCDAKSRARRKMRAELLN